MIISLETARERILGSFEKLPTFSILLNRLMATLSHEDVSFRELAAIIETDAVLAGNLLRVVNSPLYGRQFTINSVRHAIAILGSVKIRNLVLGLSLSGRWTDARVSNQWNPRQFNTHSVAVAVLSDLVALETPVPYPEGAFTAGLLHDVGKLLIAVATPETFESLFDIYATCGDAANDAELEIVGVTHAEISGAIARKWNLPTPIQEAVAHHHSPGQAAPNQIHLAHIVQAADYYTNSLGLGMPPYRHHPVNSFEPSGIAFGLGERILKLAETFQVEFEGFRTFC